MVDTLLEEGFGHLTVLDIAGSALRIARQRLGELASQVVWIEADITKAELPREGYDIWHDRAVFHFLTESDERRLYVHAVQHAVKPGGHVIVATFALDGPAKCSGLDVVRYSLDSLLSEFGAEFHLASSAQEAHITPMGSEQRFLYCCLRKVQ